jgi:hypothetical protein
MAILSRSRIIGVSLAVAVVVVMVSLALFVGPRAGRQNPAKRLPSNVVDNLVRLQGKLSELAQESQREVQFLEEDEGRLRQLRGLVESAKRMADAAGVLLLAVDGLAVNRGLLHTETQLYRDALRILARVADGIVKGEGYLTLDRALLILEKPPETREAGFFTADETLDQVDKLIAAAADAPDAGSISELLAVTRAASGSQRRRKNALAESYQEAVKPGISSLRYIVDQLPKR